MTDVQSRTTLPAAVSTPAAARAFVQRAVAGQRDPLRIEDLTIVVSELVTNAVLHGSGDVTLNVVSGDDRVRVEVRDDEPAHDLPPVPDRADAGRGLLLVSRIATDWGVRPDGGGKVVWADVAV